MGKTAEALNASFVLSLGDHFYPEGIKGSHLNNSRFNVTFEHVYTSPALQIPWFVLLWFVSMMYSGPVLQVACPR